MKIFVIFAIGLLSACSSLCAQNQRFVSIRCTGKEFEIEYPQNFFSSRKDEQYAEGFFAGFIYKDTTFLQIHCGFQTKHPFLKGNDYVVDSTDQKPDCIKRIGHSKGGNSFWREDYYPKLHVTLAYFQVKQKRKHEFDLCLEAFEKKYRN